MKLDNATRKIYYQPLIALDFIHGYITMTSTLNKQLLDEVEHDIMNYQNRGLCYLPQSSASADNTDKARGFDNSSYHAKTEFNNCFIIHFSYNSSSETEAKRSAILFLRRTLQLLDVFNLMYFLISKWVNKVCCWKWSVIIAVNFPI